MMAVLNPSFSSTTSCSNWESTPYVQFLQVFIQDRCLVFHCFKNLLSPWTHVALPCLLWHIVRIFLFFFPSGIFLLLNSLFFEGSFDLPFSCLPGLRDETATPTWGSLDVSGAADAAADSASFLRQEVGEDTLRFLLAFHFCHFHYLSFLSLLWFI